METQALNYSGLTWETTWERVAIYETPHGEYRGWREREPPLPMTDERFAEVMFSATSWVDLTAQAVDEGTLIVELVWDPDPAPSMWPGRKVAVNYNGLWPWAEQRNAGIKTTIRRIRRFLLGPLSGPFGLRWRWTELRRRRRRS
jgi:hypothetical protein